MKAKKGVMRTWPTARRVSQISPEIDFVDSPPMALRGFNHTSKIAPLTEVEEGVLMHQVRRRCHSSSELTKG